MIALTQIRKSRVARRGSAWAPLSGVLIWGYVLAALAKTRNPYGADGPRVESFAEGCPRPSLLGEISLRRLLYWLQHRHFDGVDRPAPEGRFFAFQRDGVADPILCARGDGCSQSVEVRRVGDERLLLSFEMQDRFEAPVVKLHVLDSRDNDGGRFSR